MGDEIIISVNDTGFNGAYGNAQVTTNTIDIFINEMNDAPVIVGPAQAHATRNLENALPSITIDYIDIEQFKKFKFRWCSWTWHGSHGSYHGVLRRFEKCERRLARDAIHL